MNQNSYQGGLSLVELYYERTQRSPILFRIHNDTSNDFETYREAYPSSLQKLFVEGISGGNSTSLLLRESIITPFWAHKIKEAALTQVLIIDERNWKSINDKINDDKTGDYYFHLYKLKNIHLLHAEVVAGKFTFINLKHEVVAELKHSAKFEWKRGFQEEYGYHFISLHQGLLDRMVKHCRKQLETDQILPNRQKAASHIFKQFREAFEAHFRYLVHSGRAKTLLLPEDVAFLQSSSLESAFADCKYSLTEFLYTTIIEESEK